MEPRSVLVVEDDPDCAEVLAEALRAWGHEVRLAADELEMETALRVRTPDIVLVDGMLGGDDGIALVRRLREDLLAGVPVALTTGRSRAEVVREARAAGIDRILIKPLDLGTLLELVEKSGTVRTRAVGA